jgi:hypothetical protein
LLNAYEEAFGFEVVGIETIRPAAAIEKNASQKKGPPDAVNRPTKIRVVIEKVNLETATITASCLLIGLTDNVTKPGRLENLQVARKAKITDRGKELTLADLTSLPRDTHFYLLLRVYEGEEFGFEVVGIDTIPPPANAPGAPQKLGTRQQAVQNLSMLMGALKKYHDDPRHGRLPPAVVMGKDGKGGVPHSWRVEILPYVGEKALYDDYRFDEPWDSKHNRALIPRMPAVFRSPRDKPASTNAAYFALVTPRLQPRAQGNSEGGGVGGVQATPNYDHGTIFSNPEGTHLLTQVPDGISNVIALVEAKREIAWTQPDDVPYSADQPLPKLGGWFAEGWHAGFADGEVRMLAPENDDTTIRHLFTIGDGYPAWPKFVR